MKKRIIKINSLFGETLTFIENPNLKDKIKFGSRERKKLEEANKALGVWNDEWRNLQKGLL